MIEAPIKVHRKLDSIFYLFSMLFIGFVMLGYVVFIFNLAGFTFRMDAPLIIGIISTITFFPLALTGIRRDGYSLPSSVVLAVEYWAYCLYILPLFIIAAFQMIRRRERRWAKTFHR